jgi:alcohol dehydrogenase class IV
MDKDFLKANELLQEFKGGKYINGLGKLSQVGTHVAELGKNVVIIADTFPGSQKFLDEIVADLLNENVEILKIIKGANPNVPKEDLKRITGEIKEVDPEIIVSFGGGSTTDASKSAGLLLTLGGDIEDYFGIGLVSKEIEKQGLALTPHVAIQTAASSAAHLTKYSNITDMKTNQKKLVVDNAIVPILPVFDYQVTFNAPFSLTADGALDGMAHALEVLFSAVNSDNYTDVETIALEAIRLIVKYLPIVLDDPNNALARTALGLGTDLGGYCIMVGGTNGAHLTSFSFVDILSHGRACAMMNPYYTVFFSPAIQEPLKGIAKIFSSAGYGEKNIEQLHGRNLGVAVAKAMLELESKIGFPTTLSEIDGFSDQHIERALKAAKDPQLKMKLENMPVPLTAETVDEFMGPILFAAKTGDLSKIKNL